MTKRGEFISFEPTDREEWQPNCGVEFVPDSKRARKIYVVFDGQRIAVRVRIGGGKVRWRSLVEGYGVIDEADGKIIAILEPRPEGT